VTVPGRPSTQAACSVLSEVHPAPAEELRSALLCNPFDRPRRPRATIENALQLDETERRERLQRLAATIAHHDVLWWVERELNAIARAPTAPEGRQYSSRPLNTAARR
jgi:trehalose-6-phosphate synthase